LADVGFVLAMVKGATSKDALQGTLEALWNESIRKPIAFNTYMYHLGLDIYTCIYVASLHPVTRSVSKLYRSIGGRVTWTQRRQHM